MPITLSPQQISVMCLIRKTQGEDGWAPVSKKLWQLIVGNPPLITGLPLELVEREQFDVGGGRVRFTDEGNTLMKWLV